MPRRSGTDVLFTKWTRPAVFSAGRVLFFGCCFFGPVCGALLLRSVARCCSGLWRVAAPVCGAPLFRPMPRRHPRSASVAVPVCAVSPLSPCAVPLFRPVPCRHPRSASVAVPVCAVSPLRFASHCLPLSASCRPPRFADGRRRRILRTVWRGICAGCGALAAFPCVAAIPVGSPARFFVALNFQISFYFRTFARL